MCDAHLRVPAGLQFCVVTLQASLKDKFGPTTASRVRACGSLQFGTALGKKHFCLEEKLKFQVEQHDFPQIITATAVFGTPRSPTAVNCDFPSGLGIHMMSVEIVAWHASHSFFHMFRFFRKRRMPRYHHKMTVGAEILTINQLQTSGGSPAIYDSLVLSHLVQSWGTLFLWPSQGMTSGSHPGGFQQLATALPLLRSRCNDLLEFLLGQHMSQLLACSLAHTPRREGQEGHGESGQSQFTNQWLG